MSNYPFVTWKWVKGEKAATDLMKKIAKAERCRFSGDFIYCGDIRAERKYKYEEGYGWREWWLLSMPTNKDTGYKEYNFREKALEEFKNMK